ncbi:DUF222 domain-containing protein, partial [Rhizobium johnstonii]|uniref:DUF222 domain-containing protein n=1 Tax=Rhizobium johnstonii TaxID=3019933 RepID=UPI003F94D95E
FTGEMLPAKHPHVGEALRSGLLSVAAAALITGMLDRVVLRCGLEQADHAEQVLVEQAVTLSLEMLARVVKKTEALLDPDGVKPKEDQLYAERSCSVYEDADGAIVLKGRFDPESGTYIKNAIEALVSAELRRARDAFGSAGAQKECRCGARPTGDA